MLSAGVDRVVEQVINPKMHKDFKPQIDRAICAYLGIDWEQWQRKQKLKEELQRRQEEIEAGIVHPPPQTGDQAQLTQGQPQAYGGQCCLG